MRIAVYGRKSIYSDKSDSIDNQFRMAREYCDCHFSAIDEWREFQDEDFSGKDIKRPGLSQLMDAIVRNEFDALVVYQLDRLSRSVRDFANLYSILDEHQVMFVSLKERIDTSTPIGRAMMYVTVVFAQMERETIANRVGDNMRGLAKKGLWAGGKPPVGYVTSKITLNGKKHSAIAPDEESTKYIKWLMKEFLDCGRSVQALSHDFRRRGIRARSGAFFSPSQIYVILTSPYCAPACPETLAYYRGKGCDIGGCESDWDGSHGVMVYGRRNSAHLLQPTENWSVCPGQHEPVVDAALWLSVQERLRRNSSEKPGKKYPPSLLRGVLRCSCGRLMQTTNRTRPSGAIYSAYYCTKRTHEGNEACSTRTTECSELDNKVLEVLREIGADHALISQYLAEKTETTEIPDRYDKEIAKLEANAKRLVQSISEAGNSTATKYIISELERVDASLTALKQERDTCISLSRKAAATQKDAAKQASEIERFISGLEGFDAEQKNNIIRSVVKECVWDGEQLVIRL